MNYVELLNKSFYKDQKILEYLINSLTLLKLEGVGITIKETYKKIIINLNDKLSITLFLNQEDKTDFIGVIFISKKSNNFSMTYFDLENYNPLIKLIEEKEYLN